MLRFFISPNLHKLPTKLISTYLNGINLKHQPSMTKKIVTIKPVECPTCYNSYFDSTSFTFKPEPSFIPPGKSRKFKSEWKLKSFGEKKY